MTSVEWETVKRRLLSGWVLRKNQTVDDAGYFSWLKPFSLEAIDAALDGLRGTEFMPKANEIARRIAPAVRDRAEYERRELERYAARVRAGGGCWAEYSQPDRDGWAAKVVAA